MNLIGYQPNIKELTLFTCELLALFCNQMQGPQLNIAATLAIFRQKVSQTFVAIDITAGPHLEYC